MGAGFYGTLWESAKITLRVVWRAVRQLFHEATGAIFAMFAAYGAVMVWRQWRTKPAAWLVGFAVVYAVVMAIFSFTSFRRAKRVR
jgi:hypothetical protein